MKSLPLRILNVAEKPSIARKITEFLSMNVFNKETSLSKYNPIFSFPYAFKIASENIQESSMKFTSVTGHLTQLNYLNPNSKWKEINAFDLFSAAVKKDVKNDKKPILWNLENLSKKCDLLILWLDCDREGEAIAFDVIDICRKANPKIQIKRAIFSVVEGDEIQHAIDNLIEPNKNLSLAVELRQELDLRIGSSYTVFQTVTLQEKHKDLKYKMISYGPCQIPTLAFVIQKYKEKISFVSKKFWFLEGMYTSPTSKEQVVLNWQKENHSTSKEIDNILKKFSQTTIGKITNISETERIKYKPYPLNTIQLQKLSSDNLNFSADQTMEAAELLYNKGFISYPRTETNSFKPSTNFYKLVELQKENHLLGEYASFLLKNKIYPPRAGNKNDNSHPPIYPARFLPSFEESDQNFTKEEILLYELIARSFLASCSKDATAIETKYDVEIEGESFFFKELLIKDLNYLTIYPYDKWHETVKLKEKFVIDQILNNVKVTKKEGKTYPPKLLNESQLIDLMDINGIGTDSTIHEHIKKIQEREYAIKLDKLFYPTALGYALIETYEQLGLKIIKPDLRSKMEKEMMLIVEGSEEKDKILKRNLIEYQEIYKKLEERKGEFEEIFFRLFNENREKFNNNTKEKSFRKKKSI